MLHSRYTTRDLLVAEAVSACGFAFHGNFISLSRLLLPILTRVVRFRIVYSMSKLPQARAFVVQLSDETDRSARLPSGRIEHLDSGLRGRFSCREELWRFIERVLAQETEKGEKDA